MSVWQFIRTRLFFKHIIIIVAITFILIWGILRILDIYTRHGKHYVVPDVKGLTIAEIEANNYDGNFDFFIIDSVFDNKRPKGTVIEQEPVGGVNVKYKRKIYLTTVAIMPEMVNMPNLEDLTLRQALAMLETYGLRQGRLEYIPDLAENAVLQQKYKGRKINPGTPIEKGSRIDIVLGKGLKTDEGEEIVPDLLGKFRNEAVSLIGASSMNVGAEIYMDGKDTINARVVKQSPKAGEKKSYGHPIDIWYKSNKKFDFNSFLNDSIE